MDPCFQNEFACGKTLLVGAKRDRQDRVLDAALGVVGSASEVAWQRAVSFDELELATGIDRRQIVRDFGSKHALMEELIQHWYVREAEKFGLTVSEPVREVEEPESSLHERLAQIAELSNSINRESSSFVVQMTIWALQSKEPVARKALREVYQGVDAGVAAVTKDYLEQLAAQDQPLVDGITVQELAVLLTAIVEGLAIRHAVDPDSVPDDLTARAWTALIEGIIQSPGEKPRTLGDVCKDIVF